VQCEYTQLPLIPVETHREKRARKERERWARVRDEVNAKRRAAYALDGEAQRVSQREYAAQHRERERVRSREWRRNNPARVRHVNVSYYERNRDAVLEQKRDYARRKPEIIRANNRNRKARLRGAGGRITIREWREIVGYFGGHCAYCGRMPEMLTMDHVIPIAKGGRHVADNIVPACMSCNGRKSDRDLIGLLMLDANEALPGMSDRFAAEMAQEVG
jgi:5-methylcytosine-specific restriction endonuclease McrA